MLLIEFEEKGYDLEKLKPYNDFLVECSQKDYSEAGTHKHHILPRFMKGSNKKQNIIVLSYEDHLNSHLILAECFNVKTKEYFGNVQSAVYIKNWVDSPIDLRSQMSIAHKNKIVSEKTRKLIGLKSKGRRWSIESRKRVSDYRKGKFTGENNPMFNKEFSEEHRRKISIANTGEKNGMFNKQHSEESKMIMHEKLSDGRRKNEKASRAKKIEIVATGEKFGCIKMMMAELNLSYYYITKGIKTGIYKVL